MGTLSRKETSFLLYLFIWVIVMSDSAQESSAQASSARSVTTKGFDCSQFPGWVSITGINSSCFYFSNSSEKANWSEAFHECRRLGGNLTVPTSKETNNAIWEAARKRNNVTGYSPWIGLRQCSNRETFFFCKGGKSFYTIHGKNVDDSQIFKGWRKGEPNDGIVHNVQFNNSKMNYTNEIGQQDCVHYWIEEKISGWDDLQCNQERQFICERPLPDSGASSTATPTTSTVVATTVAPTASTVNASTPTPAVELCKFVINSTDRGVFSWPKAFVGENKTITCPRDNTITVTRWCTKSLGKVFWSNVDIEVCPVVKDATSQKIFNISKRVVNSTNVEIVSEEINNVTSGRNLTSDAIFNTAFLLEKIVNTTGKDIKVADNVLQTIDNVLSSSANVIQRAQEGTNSSARILVVVNKLLEEVNLTEHGSYSRNFTNFEVRVSSYDPVSFSGVTFPESGSSSNKISDTKAVPSSRTTSILLPDTIFNDTITTNFTGPQTVIFALYREAKLFSQHASIANSSSKRLNSYVISSSIKGLKVSNLTHPVVLNFVKLKPGVKNSSSCRYWDLSQLRWSNEGCEFKGVEKDGRITCHCNHLTNFAMLMDYYSNDHSQHEKVLSLISYIGCAVSLLGLILTIITILLFRDLRTKPPLQILLNFCIALSLTLVVFLSAAERSKTSSSASCRAAAIALHYFTLTAFMWMAVEGFNMYLMFVKIVPSYFPKFILKSCVVAWGLPAVVVSITVGLALDQYGNDKYCRLQGTPFLVAFLAPILVILFMNTIAFLLILHSLMKSGSKVNSDRKDGLVARARRGAAVFVTLGLTWMFAVLAFKDAKIVFQYLFCIFNSLQGLFVFVFYCILPSQTRRRYRYITKKVSTQRPNQRWKQKNEPNTGGGIYRKYDEDEDKGQSTYLMDTLTVTMSDSPRRHSSPRCSAHSSPCSTRRSSNSLGHTVSAESADESTKRKAPAEGRQVTLNVV